MPRVPTLTAGRECGNPSPTGPTRRLRVMFVIGTMGAGGAERQVLAYLQSLDRTKFEVALALDHRTGALLPEVPADVWTTAFWDAAARRGTLLWGLCKFRQHGWARQRHVRQICRDWRPDVLYERTFMATLQMAESTRGLGIPRIAAAVAEPAPEVQRWFPLNPQRGFLRAQAAYAGAQRVVCNSVTLRREMQAYFHLPGSRMVVLPNVLDPQRLPKHVLPCFSAETQRPALACVGRIDPEKGVFDLLTALKILQAQGQSPVDLHMVGTGPSLAKFQEQARGFGLEDRITYHGHLANPLEIVSRCELFVFPSHSEGSPNALIEALAVGIPVVAADSRPGGPRELLDDGRWGALVPIQQPQALAAAVQQALNALPPAQERARAAAQVIRKRHDLRSGVLALEQLLMDVHQEFIARREVPSKLAETTDSIPIERSD